MINQTLPEVFIILALAKEVIVIFSLVKSQNFHIGSAFFVLNHYPVTIASLEKDSRSFDNAFLICIFLRPKYLSFSWLSFRHVKNPLFSVLSI